MSGGPTMSDASGLAGITPAAANAVRKLLSMEGAESISVPSRSKMTVVIFMGLALSGGMVDGVEDRLLQ